MYLACCGCLDAPHNPMVQGAVLRTVYSSRRAHGPHAGRVCTGVQRRAITFESFVDKLLYHEGILLYKVPSFEESCERSKYSPPSSSDNRTSAQWQCCAVRDSASPAVLDSSSSGPTALGACRTHSSSMALFWLSSSGPATHDSDEHHVCFLQMVCKVNDDAAVRRPAHALSDGVD